MTIRVAVDMLGLEAPMWEATSLIPGDASNETANRLAHGLPRLWEVLWRWFLIYDTPSPTQGCDLVVEPRRAPTNRIESVAESVVVNAMPYTVNEATFLLSRDMKRLGLIVEASKHVFEHMVGSKLVLKSRSVTKRQLADSHARNGKIAKRALWV